MFTRFNMFTVDLKKKTQVGEPFQAFRMEKTSVLWMASCLSSPVVGGITVLLQEVILNELCNF